MRPSVRLLPSLAVMVERAAETIPCTQTAASGKGGTSRHGGGGGVGGPGAASRSSDINLRSSSRSRAESAELIAGRERPHRERGHRETPPGEGPPRRRGGRDSPPGQHWRWVGVSGARLGTRRPSNDPSGTCTGDARVSSGRRCLNRLQLLHGLLLLLLLLRLLLEGEEAREEAGDPPRGLTDCARGTAEVAGSARAVKTARATPVQQQGTFTREQQQQQAAWLEQQQAAWLHAAASWLTESGRHAELTISCHASLLRCSLHHHHHDDTAYLRSKTGVVFHNLSPSRILDCGHSVCTSRGSVLGSGGHKWQGGGMRSGEGGGSGSSSATDGADRPGSVRPRGGAQAERAGGREATRHRSCAQRAQQPLGQRRALRPLPPWRGGWVERHSGELGEAPLRSVIVISGGLSWNPADGPGPTEVPCGAHSRGKASNE
ncbi:unnamed protein product [Lampetra fluviatilis]